MDGSTQNRQELVETFQSENGPPIFLSSLRAGGTGLNLTQADHVFLMDPWWNPAVEDQAADRAHRIGQDKPVFVYRIIAKNTVEGKILELQKKKRKIVEIALLDTGSCYFNNQRRTFTFEIKSILSLVKDKNDCFVHLFFDNICECG